MVKRYFIQKEVFISFFSNGKKFLQNGPKLKCLSEGWGGGGVCRMRKLELFNFEFENESPIESRKADPGKV